VFGIAVLPGCEAFGEPLREGKPERSYFEGGGEQLERDQLIGVEGPVAELPLGLDLLQTAQDARKDCRHRRGAGDGREEKLKAVNVLRDDIAEGLFGDRRESGNQAGAGEIKSMCVHGGVPCCFRF
jgi:hypothetical protein